ncbi:VTT domain-containing protein [Novosphingobium sp. 1949]|uniref:TVP38/TMEM64 family membrane protein n=1 Tax=Novosphingobium organovorum TaxID=2930092 RepID=A0ABT0BG28_9SPHN|nr:VTT domain-containing protein [Novosphingobium organovorum]MCJ2184012.1 VTT domain-containing protein [Novosphingobium organovorum]
MSLRALLAGLASAPGAQAHALFVTLAQRLGDLQAAMAANWVAFGSIQIAVAATGILPAAVVAMMAGASFGVGAGIAISAISTMLGGWIAFGLARSFLRPWIARWIGRSDRCLRWDAAVGRESWRFVLLLRISPVMPFAPTSYALGLSSIDQRSYLLGTLASLPALVGYVVLGALGGKGLAMMAGSANLLQWAAWGVGFAFVAIALLRVRTALGKMAQATPSEA